MPIGHILHEVVVKIIKAEDKGKNEFEQLKYLRKRCINDKRVLNVLAMENVQSKIVNGNFKKIDALIKSGKIIQKITTKEVTDDMPFKAVLHRMGIQANKLHDSKKMKGFEWNIDILNHICEDDVFLDLKKTKNEWKKKLQQGCVAQIIKKEKKSFFRCKI